MMWFFPTKKEVHKEFKKIENSFKIRDNEIAKLRDKIETNTLKIATLEGSYLVLSQKSQVLVSPKSQASLKKSQETIETRLINRIKQNKKSMVMAEIVKLMPSYSVIEMFEVIVKQKGLCSKASFYRYIDSLKSQKLVSNENKVRLN